MTAHAPKPTVDGTAPRAALGDALRRRADEVGARLIERSEPLDANLRHRFDQAARQAVVPIAAWIADGDVDAARHSAAATAGFFTTLASERQARLDSVAALTLRWRDVVIGVLHETAEACGIADDVVATAVDQVRDSCDTSVILASRAFEVERRRVHDELMSRQAELHHQANHDTLTGLANRALVVDRIEQALARSRRNGSEVLVLFIDLDHFKEINDGFGHSAGDELLCAVVERLHGVIRSTDTLGRLGGDEFVVVAEWPPEIDSRRRLAKRIQQQLAEPFHLASVPGLPLRVTASLGVATAAGHSAEELLRNADTAMYQAKAEGRDCSHVFVPSMTTAAQVRNDLRRAAAAAAMADEFEAAYLPVIDLAAGNVVGVEALARWTHPTHGEVAPDEFIPLLVATGEIVEMGRAMLARACADGARWQAAGHDLEVTVNVAGRQLDDPDFIGDLTSALAASGLAPERLVLDVTEAELAHNAADRIATLSEASSWGVRVALDDVGAGPCSLEQLRQLPIDTMKIDRSVVARMADAGGDLIVATLINLAHGLGVRALAEGIESPWHLERLSGHGCELGQGFVFTTPLPADAVGSFVAGALQRRSDTLERQVLSSL